MGFKEKMHNIRQKSSQVFLAMKRKETPWYAKAMGGLTIAYALSPIDLIPDFIPILGYLDDLIILPIMISMTIKLIPKKVWEECEEEAKELWKDGKPKRWYYAIPIIIIWLLLLWFILYKIFIH